MRTALVENLPSQAWLFRADAEGRASLTHGAGVRLGDAFFFEGCTAGRDLQSLAEHTEVFGTGGIRTEFGWVFVPPSHTLEALYVCHHPDGWAVSNSLAFLIAHFNLTIPWHPRYNARIATMVWGLDRYRTRLFAHNGVRVDRYVYDNIRIDTAGEVQLTRKPMPPPFESFGDYEAYLARTLEAVFLDGAAPDQHAIYHPVTSVSSGYDSAAAAALASRLGCEEAVTITKSKGGDDDDGTAVGEALGLHVHACERPAEVSGDFDSVAEFIAPGTSGEDFCYRPFGPWLERRIFLTGFHGDKVWDSEAEPNGCLSRGDSSGAGLQEFRLWTDFVHVPVPMIGARRHPEINRITNADEMTPWRLNRGDYNRPIPRRLAEEAGVPRDAFGQAKKATSFMLFRNPNLMGPIARRQRNQLVPRIWVVAAYFGWSALVRRLRFRVWWELRRISPLAPAIIGRLSHRLMREKRIDEHASPIGSLNFIAAVHLVAKRYRSRLQPSDGNVAAAPELAQATD